jgi:hypothetical protein
VGTVVEEKQIQELPLDGRNYLSLAGLSPGILRGAQGGRGEQTSPEGAYRSRGLPFDQAAILVDGVDNAARTVLGPLVTQAQTLKPSVDAISEFKVVTHNVSAEYGYKAGAQVIVSTKGGTNQLHGSLYEFHRNRAVSANDFMFNRDTPRDPQTNELTESPPPYIRNQFGGTFGGPIIEDKTFFFFSFQGTRLHEGGDSFLQSVPSPLARQGDFSQEVGGANRGNLIYDPLTRGPGGERQPFAGSIIPPDRMDPVAMRVLELYPLPNVPGEEFNRLNYFAVQRFSNDNEVYDVRLDHNFNHSHRLFGRYSHRNEDRVFGATLPFPARASTLGRFTGHQVSVNYNATFGARMHNEFRLGYTHFPVARLSEYRENLNETFGLENAAVDQYPDLVSDEFRISELEIGPSPGCHLWPGQHKFPWQRQIHGPVSHRCQPGRDRTPTGRCSAGLDQSNRQLPSDRGRHRQPLLGCLRAGRLESDEPSDHQHGPALGALHAATAGRAGCAKSGGQGGIFGISLRRDLGRHSDSFRALAIP